MKIRAQALLFVSLVSILAGMGCGRIRARTLFKDGNKAYKEENFKKAVELYTKTVELAPNMAEAWFYLGSAEQALYRPGKDTPENKAHLDAALKDYLKSLELNDGSTPALRKVKKDTLSALTVTYADEPYKDYDKALQYAQLLVQDNPNDSRTRYAMANLNEKFNHIDEAEQLYKQIYESPPEGKTEKERLANKDKACGALAAFYNKALWDGKSKFDQAVAILEQCANLDPKNETGYYKVATFYWDKAYRDPLLTDKEKDQYADKGLEGVDKALQLKPDYVEALIYKNLLYRVKAQVTTNPKLRMQYLDQAQTLQKQAVELKKEQMASGGTPSPSPATN
jgi:tetratricopeptide (TPR) repeat protein